MSKDLRVMWLFILKQESKVMQVCVSCVQESASHGHFPFFFSFWHQFISQHSDFLLSGLLNYAESFEETEKPQESNFAWHEFCQCMLFIQISSYRYIVLCSAQGTWKLEFFHLSFNICCYFFTLTNNQLWFIFFIASSEYSILVFLNSLYDLMISSLPT